jgi:signal transduction histidine kinase
MRVMLLDLLLAGVGLVSVVPNLGGDPDLLPLVALVVAPLVVRRRWPVPVFAWVLAGSALLGLSSPYAVPGLAVLIALHTVAASRPLPVALAAAGVLEVGVVVAAVRQPGPWMLPAVFLTGMLVAALGLGLYVAAHRALVAGLRDRTAALERERDTAAALAAAAERARIARELHDIVAHHLTVMVTLAEGAAAKAVAAPEQAAEAMRTVSATGRLALSDTRRLLGVLRDRTGAAAPLAPVADLGGLDELIERVRTAGLPVRYEVEGSPPAGAPGAVLALHRIVQEALTNTMKHAGPDANATVHVRYSAGDIHVEVTDDGTGAGTIKVGAGRGLIGMRERVDAFGGEVRAGPRTPHGWQVSARLELAGERPG